MHVSDVATIEAAQVCYSSIRTWDESGSSDAFLDLLRRAYRARGFGDFWMHCLVAEGSADVAVEADVSLWDLAALQVIVEEAGGTFTDLAGRPTAAGGSAVSTNGTKLNGALIAGPQQLADGDEIGIGDARLVFVAAAAD